MKGLFSRSLNGEGLVAILQLKLTPQADTILPPFTSRTLKSILGAAECLREVWSYYNSRKKFKPVTLRVLTTDRGTPLYKNDTGQAEGKPLIAKRGHTYHGYIAVYAREIGEVVLPGCDESVDIGYGRFHIELSGMEMRILDDLGRDDYHRVKVTIRTPMTISLKVMSPPVRTDSKIAKLLEKTRDAYKLLPTPGYMAAQAARQWLGIVKGLNPSTEVLPYSIGRLADIMVAEVHYRLSPVTIVYGKSESGMVKRVRGVTGFIILEPLNEGIKYALSRLLEFASFLGLGKSRSIGFGEIDLEYV